MGVLRLTARVVPVNENRAALLLLDQDPSHPGALRWVTTPTSRWPFQGTYR